MLDPLAAAIDAADWPRALDEALAAWRAERAPELADLVDAHGARLLGPPLPHQPQHRHAWWIEHAARYDPAAVTYLAAQAHQRVDASDVTKPEIRARWGDAHPLIATLLEGSPRWFEAVSPNSRLNAVDRLAAVLTWPPEPRAAALLAGALETASLATWGTMLDPVCRLIADALVALADVRALPRLAQLAAIPPGDDVDLLTRTRHAARACRALDVLRGPPDPDLAALNARLAPDPATPPPARIDDRAAAAIAELWREVGAHPDELGPRLVLGDALVELGENRGELIILQCAGAQREVPQEELARAGRRARQLIEQQWRRWLGPLAPFLHWQGCQLHRGMLEVVRVGVEGSPDAGWREAAGHHELAVVHTVKPHHASPAHYAEFVEGLARPPRHLGLTGPEVIGLLHARLGSLPLQAVSYTHLDRARPAAPASPTIPLAAATGALAKLAPGLEVITFEYRCPPGELDAVLPQLPRMFRRLRRVEVPRRLIRGPAYAETLARYRSLGFVVMI